LSVRTNFAASGYSTPRNQAENSLAGLASYQLQYS
jgi:hypothetical protein